MDAFTEKDLIDILRKISFSLEGIKAELKELNKGVRELGAEFEDEEDNEGMQEGITAGEPVIEFVEEDESEEEDNI